MLTTKNWRRYLAQGFTLTSSGTTGAPKSIFQTPEKLAAANLIALDAQGITASSRVLTVCRMTHAGGALAQTLPALSIGAHVDIVAFNAFSFLRGIQGYTHTHLVPAHCELIMQTRSFRKADLAGLFVACGSDRVPFEIIEAFVARGAVFMCNWGMTEIGPIAINTVFDSLDKVLEYRAHAIRDASLLGDRVYCETKVEDGVLYVRGDCCVYNDWFCTGDRVVVNRHNALYYLGRSSKDASDR
jgi:acyl-CoA synthetase (AMP-forming)/AMP-acid ligase II